MSLIDRVREKHLTLMQRTVDTLANILRAAPKDALNRYTDGPDGWTVTEVVCHLRDTDELFYQRVIHILTEDQPELLRIEHERLAVERSYKAQDPFHVYDTLCQSRSRFIELFESLTPEQWERSGIHPEYGEWTLTDAVMQVGTHEANHIEQITRILTQALPNR